MPLTCEMYSPDFAQWKCGVLPGRTITLPGGYAFNLSASKFFAEPDIKHSGNDGVDPILRMHMRHQFYSAGYFYPNDIWAGFCGVAYQDCEKRRLGKCSKRQKLDVIRKNFAEFFQGQAVRLPGLRDDERNKSKDGCNRFHCYSEVHGVPFVSFGADSIDLFRAAVTLFAMSSWTMRMSSNGRS